MPPARCAHPALAGAFGTVSVVLGALAHIPATVSSLCGRKMGKPNLEVLGTGWAGSPAMAKLIFPRGVVLQTCPTNKGLSAGKKDRRQVLKALCWRERVGGWGT